MRNTLKQLKDLKDKNSDSLIGAGLFLTKSEKEQFQEKLLELVIDFSTISRSNRKKEKDLAQEYCFMSFLNDESMFHEITEISI